MPGSAEAHERSMLAVDAPPAPPARYVVLETADVPLRGAPKLARDVVAAGGWARCVRALAEDVQTCELIESVSVRVRLGLVAGYAMWVQGRAAGGGVLRPYPRRVTHEGLAIALGLLTIEYGNCDRWVPWVRPCGARDVRLRADGTLRAHKSPDGRRCT